MMNIKFLFTAGSLLLGASLLSAQSFDEARSTVQADLDAALSEFADLQKLIGSERVPLSNELNELEATVREKRRDQSRAQRLADSSTSSISQLETEIESMEKNINYMSNMLNEYARQFEATSVSIAEKQLYDEMVETVVANIEDDQMDVTDKFDAQFNLVEESLVRIGEVLGGRIFEGTAIVPGGDAKDGKFLVLGPVSFFASDDGMAAGMVNTKEPIRAKIVEIEGATPGIAAAVVDGDGVLPFDPTLNDALELEKAETNILDEVNAGGIWVWPIIIAFFIAMIVGLVKAAEIYSIRTPGESVLQQTLQYIEDGQIEEAKKYVRGIGGHFGRLFQSAVKHAGDSKELLEEVLYERMLESQPKIERLLPIIAVTAATAPLLGLLGTVTGMINTFQQITLFGTSDASKLAGGISEALITTKFGLIAAIPSLVVHALLSRKAQGILAAMEKYSSAFINGIEVQKK
ncbi:MAG: MotA/TolQ/ExbB proton channel family protein [Opitutales bacterium]|nr:MotA/TolQ/ExbB proton channel family protein [Opitutales bacterium]NRA27803.1 MotA/TolQ/ExbB proton channel family protein [Opitutales bacterium]